MKALRARRVLRVLLYVSAPTVSRVVLCRRELFLNRDGPLKSCVSLFPFRHSITVWGS